MNTKSHVTFVSKPVLMHNLSCGNGVLLARFMFCKSTSFPFERFNTRTFFWKRNKGLLGIHVAHWMVHLTFVTWSSLEGFPTIHGERGLKARLRWMLFVLLVSLIIATFHSDKQFSSPLDLFKRKRKEADCRLPNYLWAEYSRGIRTKWSNPKARKIKDSRNTNALHLILYREVDLRSNLNK